MGIYRCMDVRRSSILKHLEFMGIGLIVKLGVIRCWISAVSSKGDIDLINIGVVLLVLMFV